ncbi:MAG TPA: hypothetical protein DCO79_07050 [Spirochaeta sp.]|nr:hypothetical protein [Spirochaeta sp.]
MPYCPKCGVEVDHGTECCPLCSFSIPEIPFETDIKKEEIELKNYYEELKQLKDARKKKTRSVFFIIIILIVIGTAFNNAMQDWMSNNELTFSPYVMSSLGLFIICLIVIFGFIRRMKFVFPLLFLSSSVFLFSLDIFSNGIEWFWTLGLPLTTLSYGIVFITAIIIRKKKPGKLYSGSIILGFAAVLLVLMDSIINLYYGELMLSWSLNALFPIGSLALLLILGKALISGKTFKKLKRYLHF